MKRIYLIDCPGVVPVSAKDSDTDTVLKGVVRVENLATPAEHIPDLLARVRPEYLERTYGLEPREGGWVGEEGATIMLTAIAKKSGKLLRGGEPDQEAAAKMVLNDWIRGKIPYFAPPPERPVPAATAQLAGAAGQEATAESAVPALPSAEDQERNLGKVLGERRVKGVEQPIAKIVTMSKFLGDDARRHVEEIEEPAEDFEMADGESDGEDEDASAEEAKEPELAWDDLFEGGKPAAESSAVADAAADEFEDVDSEEVEDEEDVEEVVPAVPSATQKGKQGEYGGCPFAGLVS